jgi:vesicle transport through interaction with t-SNAREs 1
MANGSIERATGTLKKMVVRYVVLFHFYRFIQALPMFSMYQQRAVTIAIIVVLVLLIVIILWEKLS